MGRAAIISVDGHVKAPRATYRDYLEARFHEPFDEWLASVDGTPDGFVRPDFEEAQWDPQRRLDDLGTQGVVAELLFSNGVPFAVGRLDHAPDPEQTRAANMAYNRWLVDFCSAAPGRLLGQALVSFHDVDQAVADVHWAKEQGLVGILMPPLYPGATYFFDPALDPVWAACVETGLPLSQHGGVGAPNYQPVGFASLMVLATEHSWFAGRSLWQLILGGAFERFPDLRLAFVETEAWWIGPVMEQLDKRMQMGDEWTDFAEFMRSHGTLSRLPSEYWRSNCYAGISPFHPAQLSIDDLGTKDVPDDAGFRIDSGNAMFGVDYPHFESIYPSTLDHVATLVGNPHVTESDARKILYENAAELFHVDLDTLAPHIETIGFELDDVVPAGV
jgi:predicted TIM-barrel fold metal-dependent hydrolase